MARTSDDVFAKAMALTDNLSDDGEYDYEDTQEYKDRTIAILNSVIGGLYQYSNTYQKPEAGMRAIIKPILHWDEEIDLDDYICDDILPYLLAHLLMLDENQELADRLYREYQSEFSKLASAHDKMTTGKQPRKDVYGWGYCGRFTRI